MIGSGSVQSPAVSIVVEWENVRRSELSRCQMMLRRLASEAASHGDGVASSEPVELVICFDETEVDVNLTRAVVESSLGDARRLFRVRYVPIAGAEYYELKNAGARVASGELILFVDSDVVPEPGWLSALLRPFADRRVAVVAGNTYVEPVGLYSKTFALTWIFPLRATAGDVGPAQGFFANNVAFRQQILTRFPFPTIEGTSRCSCSRLAQLLTEDGARIVYSPSARVSHPAPGGPRGFVIRALTRGRDQLLVAERGWRHTPLGTARRLTHDLKWTIRSIMKNFRRVGLSPAAIPVAVALTTSFYSCCALGELGTMVNRDFMVRHFRF